MGWHPLERLERMLSAYRSSFPWAWTPIKGFQCFPGEFNWWPIPVAGIVWQWEFKKIQLVDRQGKPPPPASKHIKTKKVYKLVWCKSLFYCVLNATNGLTPFAFSSVSQVCVFICGRCTIGKRVHEKKQWRMDLYVRQLSGSCRLS